jgi:predicted enzyme related to lactoylglutathione lyase
MGLRIGQLTVDSRDPDKLAAFWQEALGWKQAGRWEDGTMLEVEIEPHDGKGFNILFLTDHEEKKVKNRLHLDLRPDDQATEVARLEGLGASRIDIGQKEVSWVVMADPEGNEFCVLKPSDPSED